MKSKKAIVLFIITFISMISGFVKESAVVYIFGASVNADVFIFASNLPIILFSSIGTVISTTFMPIYTDIRINESTHEANSFASRFGLIVTVICIIITSIAITFPNIIVRIMAPGLENVYSINNIVRIVMLSIIFLGITSIIVGALESYSHVEIATARQIPFNIILIVGVVVVHKIYGFIGSIIMILIASIAQLIFVLAYSKKINLKYLGTTPKTKKFINNSIKMIIPMAIGVMAMQINSIVSTNLASNLGVGSITKLNLANKLNMASYSTLGYLIVVLIFPILAKYAAEKNYKRIGESLSQGIIKSIIIMVPIIIVIFMLANDIVSFFFENNKFTGNEVIVTASVLKCYLLGLVFWAIKDILNRGYYSLKETKISMINGIITVILNIILSLILMRIYGISGLALATSISSVISVLLLILNLNKIKVKLNIRCIINWLMKLILPVAMMCLVYFIIKDLNVMHVVNKFQMLIKLLLVSIILLIVYIITLYTIAKNELSSIFKISLNN